MRIARIICTTYFCFYGAHAFAQEDIAAEWSQASAKMQVAYGKALTCDVGISVDHLADCSSFQRYMKVNWPAMSDLSYRISNAAERSDKRLINVATPADLQRFSMEVQTIARVNNAYKEASNSP